MASRRFAEHTRQAHVSRLDYAIRTSTCILDGLTSGQKPHLQRLISLSAKHSTCSGGK